MTLSPLLLATSGSVVGREHLRLARGGQDGHATLTRRDVAAAVVTDGCSSGRESEVGARLFAPIVLRLVVAHAASASEAHPEPGAAARALAAAVEEELHGELARVLACLAPASPGAPLLTTSAAVERFLLFGFLAAVVTEAHAIVLGIGDGLVVARGADDTVVTAIDPGPENAPPYAAYALLPGTPAPSARIHLARDAADVDVLAVATDGLAELPSPALVALASDPRWAKNPTLLEKRLRVLAAEGCFRDDATIAVLRRATRAA